ncbi:hypothetical protein [Streptomyces sp. ICC1]|nr:hypothetical protein [Streptomyces sp. ICC1]
MSIPGAYGLRALPELQPLAWRRAAARDRAAAPHGPAPSRRSGPDPSNG